MSVSADTFALCDVVDRAADFIPEPWAAARSWLENWPAEAGLRDWIIGVLRKRQPIEIVRAICSGSEPASEAITEALRCISDRSRIVPAIYVAFLRPNDEAFPCSNAVADALLPLLSGEAHICFSQHESGLRGLLMFAITEPGTVDS